MPNLKVNNNTTYNNLQTMRAFDEATNIFVTGLHVKSLGQQNDLIVKTQETANDKRKYSWFAFAIATAGVLAGAAGGFCPDTLKILSKVELKKILTMASDGCKATEKLTIALGEAENTKSQTITALMRDHLSEFRSAMDRTYDSAHGARRSMSDISSTLHEAKIAAMGRN